MRVASKGSPPDQIPDGLWCYRVDGRYVITGGALSDGGGLYRWLKDNLRLRSDDDITEDEIAERRPAGHGIAFLPFVAGERSTGYHENAAGSIVGLHTAHDAVDIVQAALESVAYRFAEIFDELKSCYKIKEIIASGGALRESPVWTQIIADVLGRDMTLPDTREASSRGAVLLALETIGKIEKLETLKPPKGTAFKFRKEHRKAYDAARKKHEELYRILL
jgi:gluconokinase